MHTSGIDFHKDYDDKAEYTAKAVMYGADLHCPGQGRLSIKAGGFMAAHFHDMTPAEMIRLGESIADQGRTLAEQQRTASIAKDSAVVCADGSLPAF